MFGVDCQSKLVVKVLYCFPSTSASHFFAYWLNTACVVSIYKHHSRYNMMNHIISALFRNRSIRGIHQLLFIDLLWSLFICFHSHYNFWCIENCNRLFIILTDTHLFLEKFILDLLEIQTYLTNPAHQHNLVCFCYLHYNVYNFSLYEFESIITIYKCGILNLRTIG